MSDFAYFTLTTTTKTTTTKTTTTKTTTTKATTNKTTTTKTMTMKITQTFTQFTLSSFKSKSRFDMILILDWPMKPHLFHEKGFGTKV